MARGWSYKGHQAKILLILVFVFLANLIVLGVFRYTSPPSPDISHSTKKNALLGEIHGGRYLNALEHKVTGERGEKEEQKEREREESRRGY